MELFSIIGVGIVVFATTNIDDILLLAAFFADRTLDVRAIVAGQFAGITALTLASAAAASLALAIPDGWIGWLGLAPLVLGCKGLLSLIRGSRESGDESGEEAGAEGVKSARTQWLGVASVTIANGGDNLGVYIPLFSRELSWTPLYGLVFAGMTAVWCATGYWLVNHPLLGARIRQYGHVALPFVLIALGLHILSDTLVLFH